MTGFTDTELLALLPYIRAIARRRAPAGYREDVVQDSIPHALRYRAQFTAETNLRTWIGLIVQQRAVELRRRLGRSAALHVSLHTDDGELLHDASVPPGQGAYLDAADFIRAAAGLPPFMREMLPHMARGSTMEEIAGATGINPNTVRTRIHRTRARLEAALQ